MTEIRVGIAVTALLLCAFAGRGQTTGSIEGRVSGSDGAALPGVSVTAGSGSLQGTRTAIADRNGFFRFPAVPPGEYTVRASRAGFRGAEKGATVRLGATARVDLVLDPFQAEEVLVSGKAPGLDPASTKTGTNYTSPDISRLPVSRNYADIIRANPGVSTDRGSTEGRSLALTIYGATSAENQWIIDGVNTTNVFKGVQGKAINNEFVQEVEVMTGGYQAEYGRALGGVVNVITKSGGNEFHGDAFVYYDSTGTAAEAIFKEGDSGVTTMRIAGGSRTDYGADLGGFILKDRLWIFGAFNRVEFRGDLSRAEPSRNVSTADRFPLDSTGDLFSAKLTWNAAASTSVVGTVFADPFTTSGAAGADPRQGPGAIFVTPVLSPDPSTWFSARDQGGTDFGIRLNQLFGSRVIATLQGSHHRDKNALAATEDIRYEDWTCVGGTPGRPCAQPEEPNSVSGGYGQISALLDHNASRRQQYQADASLYEGRHEIKGGADYVDGRTDGDGHYTGGQLVKTANEYGQPYYAHTFSAVSVNDPTPISSIHRAGSVEDFGAYLQDSWKAAAGLTLNIGLRWDGENAMNYTGQTVLRLRTSWQPRIGVAWDPWNDGATKVFAFAGRFSYALPTGLPTAAFQDHALMVTYNFDPVSVVQDPTVIGHGRSVAGAGGGTPVDSGVVAPFQDELTVGVERTLGSDLTVGLKGTYRRLGSAIETRCDLDRTSPETDHSRCAIVTPGSDGKFASGDVPTCNGLVDNPAWYSCEPTGPATPPAKRIYRGIELLARQTVGDRLWLQASYVYSSLRGNYDGGVNEGINGRSLPGQNQDFDYPALWHNGYGTLFLDRPHHFRLDGYWVTPWRLSVGLQAFVESGAPLNKLGYFNVTYGSMVFLEPRGTSGRLPALWEGNLILSYPIVFGPVTVNLQAYLFNMFNNQIAISRDDVWSTSPAEGFPATIYDPNQEQNNQNYGKVTGRSSPRFFRAAVRMSF
jgi:hypothetical protein